MEQVRPVGPPPRASLPECEANSEVQHVGGYPIRRNSYRKINGVAGVFEVRENRTLVLTSHLAWIAKKRSPTCKVDAKRIGSKSKRSEGKNQPTIIIHRIDNNKSGLHHPCIATI